MYNDYLNVPQAATESAVAPTEDERRPLAPTPGEDRIPERQPDDHDVADGGEEDAPVRPGTDDQPWLD